MKRRPRAVERLVVEQGDAGEEHQGGYRRRGASRSSDAYALTDLKPSPEFHKIAEACGGYGERVEDPAEVPAAIRRGLNEVRDGRHALLNVMCALSP